MEAEVVSEVGVEVEVEMLSSAAVWDARSVERSVSMTGA
jgi:hypothetical protein